MNSVAARLAAAPLCLAMLACGSETPDPANPGPNTMPDPMMMPEPEPEPEPEPGPAGLPVLGNYSHDITKVTLTWVSDGADPLDQPRDIAIAPDTTGEVWVVNKGDNSMTVFQGMGTDSQIGTRYYSFGSDHFLVKPVALAFGDNGNLATIHEEDDFTQGPPPRGSPADFMGPTLWPRRLDVFDGGHSSHLDMLHNSPNGMGIAWEKDNAYWVFDGHNSSITRYDFNMDHGYGGADHSDGLVNRYLEGQVSRVENIPSHMEFDHRSNLLYIADTGNNRVIALDTQTGMRGARVWPNYDGTQQFNMTDATFTTVVDGAAIGMQQPSGLALVGDILYIGDAATGTLHAFDLQGEHLDWLPLSLPAGALNGIDVDSEGNIWGVDGTSERIFRLSPAASE